MRRLLIGLALTTVVSGCGASGVDHEQPPARSVAVTRGADGQVVSPGGTLTPIGDRPRHLRVAWINAPVVPVSAHDRSLTPPPDPSVLGWWGSRVGAATGSVILIGHTVHTGGGALERLEDVPVGAVATVSGHRYRVTGNVVITKKALARQSGRLFDQSGPPRLVVVTCQNYHWDTGEWTSNVVLTATPTGG